MGITINSYQLPENFVIENMIDFESDFQSFLIGENIFYVLTPKNTYLSINGYIEKNSYSEAESYFKEILDNVFYDTDIPFKIEYNNKTWYGTSNFYIKVSCSLFPNRLKVSLFYLIKNYNEE